jgi:hypothetical protein
VSESDDVRNTGLPPARTEPEPPEVVAAQWAAQPGAPQQGCGVTDIPGTTMGRPFTRTVATPPVAMPPDEFGSPLRCTAGMLSHYNFFVWN